MKLAQGWRDRRSSGVLVLAGCNQGGTSGGKGTIKIGIELPQQG